MHDKKHDTSRANLGMMLIAIGVVYGDLGTSPLYVMRAVIECSGGMAGLSREFIIGTLSLIIWTVTILTTCKYILLAMRADNNGEGSIFSLFSLVKKYGQYLAIPAMVGGSALLADCVLTPAVTVTTAIEGLRSIDAMNVFLGEDSTVVVIITLGIISILFAVQKAGVVRIGHTFGPIMLVWFLFLAATGVYNMKSDLAILQALNPVWAVRLLFGPYNKAGFAIFGAVFLSSTGAEALYSDMGHVGRENVWASWPFVKFCLLLNYMGQGAWILANLNNGEVNAIHDMNPFFLMMPESIRLAAVLLSSAAAIVASQSLITGSFTLVSEAISLELMPPMQILYPSDHRGQKYIALVNRVVWLGCLVMVLLFQTSGNMEATHGLTNSITMLSTTVLLSVYLLRERKKRAAALMIFLFYGTVELVFICSNLMKFMHGGYFAVMLTLLPLGVMAVYHRGTLLEQRQSANVELRAYIGVLAMLREDESVNKCADNLVFFTDNTDPDLIERDIIYSILDGEPKRARCYWFLNIRVSDTPYQMNYSVESFGTDFIFCVHIRLGFKVIQCVDEYIQQIADDLIESGEYPLEPRKYFVEGFSSDAGSFSYCLIQKTVPLGGDISEIGGAAVSAKYALLEAIGSQIKWYGLEHASVITERVPLFIPARERGTLERVAFEKYREN